MGSRVTQAKPSVSQVKLEDHCSKGGGKPRSEKGMQQGRCRVSHLGSGAGVGGQHVNGSRRRSTEGGTCRH